MIFKQVLIQLLPYLIKITAINTVLITAITATMTGTMILTISKLLSVRRKHLCRHYCKFSQCMKKLHKLSIICEGAWEINSKAGNFISEL